MRAAFLRILVHLCSVLLVLPTGWCCMGASPKPANVTAATPCCCCKQEPKSTPADHVPEKPSERVPSCCCEKIPSQLPKLVDVEAPLGLIETLPTLPDLAPCLIQWEVLGSHPIVLSPSLHILHCLWLC